MAELHIKSLTCEKRQSSFGKDQTSIQIGGFTVSGPHTLGKDDDVSLNVRRTFTGAVSVDLFEEDGGSAGDHLGTITVPQGLAGRGDQTADFAAAPNARYKMVFDVHA
jgi:hypothetical protein